jgi:cold shock CspA family protein
MTGRITRLIDHQQFGVIAGEDGHDYTFQNLAMAQGRFGDLALGTSVSFEPTKGPNGNLRARAVRLVTK